MLHLQSADCAGGGGNAVLHQLHRKTDAVGVTTSRLALFRRNYTDLSKRVKRRRRLVHIDLKGFRGPITKLDHIDEKCVFLTVGYTNTIDWKRLDILEQRRLEQRRQYAQRLSQQRGLLTPRFYLRMYPLKRLSTAFVRSKKLPCVAFAVGRQNHILETFLLDELLDVQKLMPKIFAAFRKLKTRNPGNETVRQTPTSVPGNPFDAHELLLRSRGR